MGQVVEVGDLLCFVNDRPIKKVMHLNSGMVQSLTTSSQLSNDLVEHSIVGQRGSVVRLSLMSRRRGELYDVALKRDSPLEHTNQVSRAQNHCCCTVSQDPLD
jgi:hypothetical protein